MEVPYIERQKYLDKWKYRAAGNMPLSMDTSVSLALSMAGASSPQAPRPQFRRSSRSGKQSFKSFNSTCNDMGRSKSLSQDGYLYTPKNSQSWGPRRSVKDVVGKVAKEMNIKRWNGAARVALEWDGLRRDPELWVHDGDCLVHLCARGHSRRGPAFKIPFDVLLNANCQPFLKRFLICDLAESPMSDSSRRSNNDNHFGCRHASTTNQIDLYVPSPLVVDREQSFRYHIATRNFLAWLMDRPLVGQNLGTALVNLLNSMDEFRSIEEDNLRDILDYMDREGYLNMTNHPDHALGVLYFAEHFQLKDIWTDAFVHCVGMNDIIFHSTEFECISPGSRALITRSRMDMDLKLEGLSKSLSTFLEDELSVSNLGLSLGARAHLDRFRAFLQAYYVARLGYYPPSAIPKTCSTFPKSVLQSMTKEFRTLSEYLVDNNFSSSDPSNSPAPAQGGICVLQSVQAFDMKHNYKSLDHPLPLLPLAEDMPKSSTFTSRFSFRSDKMRPDPRLVTLAALSKATNARDVSLLSCPLVRAYRNFEKECAFTTVKSERIEKASHADARKVRWILIYAMLQTLISATSAPSCVRDQDSIPYNIAVPADDRVPWPKELPYKTLLRTQTDQTREEFLATHQSTETPAPLYIEIRPDIDYSLTLSNNSSNVPTPAPLSRRSSILSTISNISSSGSPIFHPTPKRHSHHEILVHGYGNGLNAVSIVPGGAPNSTRDATPKPLPQQNAWQIPLPIQRQNSMRISTESSAPSFPSRSSSPSLSPTSSDHRSHWSTTTPTSSSSSATSINLSDSRRGSLASGISTRSSILYPAKIGRSNSAISLGRRSLKELLDSAIPAMPSFSKAFDSRESGSGGLDVASNRKPLSADKRFMLKPLRGGEGKECMRITQEIRVEYEDNVRKEGQSSLEQ